MAVFRPAFSARGSRRFSRLGERGPVPRGRSFTRAARGLWKRGCLLVRGSDFAGPCMNGERHWCSWTIQARVANVLLMNTNRKRFPLAVACFLTLPIVTGLAAEARCLTPAEAQAVVGKGAVQRLGVIARVVGGEIVDAQLCEGGGLLVYRLVVMREGGRVDNVIVDATSGQRLR